jgi:hypothetical protein
MPIAIITRPVTGYRPRPVMKRGADQVPRLERERCRRRRSADNRNRPSILRSISTTSVAIELDQPLVADPEVMRDLVEHDVPDLAA